MNSRNPASIRQRFTNSSPFHRLLENKNHRYSTIYSIHSNIYNWKPQTTRFYMDDVIGSDSSSDIFMEDARELPANHRLAPRQYICYRRYRHRQRCHHQEQGSRHDSHYYRRAAITTPEPILSGASVRSCLTESSPMLINHDNCREKVMKFYETCRHRYFAVKYSRPLHSRVINTMFREDVRQV